MDGSDGRSSFISLLARLFVLLSVSSNVSRVSCHCLVSFETVSLSARY
jgi:hypothetical protein